MDEFIRKNKIFWSQFKTKRGEKKLLIEEPGRVMITHANAIFSIMINQAKTYMPVWLCGKGCEERKLILSYCPEAEIITTKKWPLIKIYSLLVAFIKYLKIFLTKDILGFHYDSIKYGDILYDAYLFENSVATIKKIDFKIIKIIAKCIFRHIKIKRVLQNGNYAGVLVSHLVGVSSGVMARSALRYGYRVYLRAGHHQTTLQCLKGLNEAYNYPKKTHPIDIDKILAQAGQNLENIFTKTLENEIIGKGNTNSANAFSKNNFSYNDQKSFNRDYNLDSQKKNVFVMLHVFNDHPHSHFQWMLFKDYYDWLIQTLNFAKTNNKVNWIFKQHPSIKNYVTKDTDLNELFKDLPPNIAYIDENKQINTQSLIHCADLIVTCLGSAGFELPAMKAIPSLVAGDNPYTGLGFALEPKTKKEYFQILENADKIDKIKPEAQKRAQAAFIYIYKVSNINMSVCPILSQAEEKDKNIKQRYWDMVCNQYATKKDIILKELNQYIQKIAKPKFKRLINE
jgi:hypothetical protein